MCRHLAWAGEPRSLAELVLDPPFGLLRQSYAPREQRHGTVNADGFGVGWYAPGVRAEPARYRRAQPTVDRRVVRVAGTGGAQRVRPGGRTVGDAPVRRPTRPGRRPSRPGRGCSATTAALEDFADAAADLRARLPASASAAVEAPTDSALLWAMTRHRLESGEPIGEALAGVVADVLAVTGGRLNLLLSDGRRLAATRCGDTLYTRAGPDGVLVASEPSDDAAGWTAVPDRSVLVADRDSLDLQPLDPQPATTGGQP